MVRCCAGRARILFPLLNIARGEPPRSASVPAQPPRPGRVVNLKSVLLARRTVFVRLDLIRSRGAVPRGFRGLTPPRTAAPALSEPPGLAYLVACFGACARPSFFSPRGDTGFPRRESNPVPPQAIAHVAAQLCRWQHNLPLDQLLACCGGCPAPIASGRSPFAIHDRAAHAGLWIAMLFARPAAMERRRTGELLVAAWLPLGPPQPGAAWP